jgi:uncharacterized DUF497 family protein
MIFEWDEEKNQTNIKKHQIDFNDAKDIFQGVRLTAIDSRRDYGESRMISIGTIGPHVCVVVYTERAGITRIISARKANQRERKHFYECIEKAKTEEN